MDLFAEFSTAWNEGLGATIATILATIALLKSMGKELKQLSSSVWRWKAWAIISKLCRKAVTLYRVHRAKSVMRRTLEEKTVRIGIRVYENCLGDDPSKSTRSKLEPITPAKPTWLNDYYVATALESLSIEGSVVKANRYSANALPPNAQNYDFVAVDANESAHEKASRIETNDKCAAYQAFSLCPRPPRFEPQHTAETISARETRFQTTYSLKDMAPPCELCWENEHREQDIRTLVDKITKYDLASIATIEITGPDGEFQEAIAETCIESRYSAEVSLIKPVVKLAIDIRQRQIACRTSGLQYEWRQAEKEELVAELREYINRQKVH